LVCVNKYYVENGEVVIIGDSGEALRGRRWQDFLHIFLELKEGLGFRGEGITGSQMYLTNYLALPHITGFIGLTGSLDEELAKEVYPEAEIVRLESAERGEVIEEGIELHINKAEKLERVKDLALTKSGERRPVLIKVGPIEVTKPIEQIKVGDYVVTGEERSISKVIEIKEPTGDSYYEVRFENGVTLRVPDGHRFFTTEGEEAVLRDGLQSSGLDVDVINAHNSYLFKEIKEIIKNAGRPGKITIVTSVASRGINIGLLEETKKQGIYLIDANLSWSSLATDQFKGRGARKPDEKAHWKGIYSLEDEIFIDYESLTKEGKAILEETPILHKADRIIRLLQEGKRRIWKYTGKFWQRILDSKFWQKILSAQQRRSSDKAERVIALLQRRILEEKIRTARSQRRIWKYTGGFWQKILNIRMNLAQGGVEILFGENAAKVKATLTEEKRARYTEEALREVDSHMGNFFRYADKYRQRMDYISRHYLVWQKLFNFSYIAELLYGIKGAYENTLRDLSAALDSIVKEISEETKVALPKQEKKSSLQSLKIAGVIIGLVAVFGIFFKAGIFSVPVYAISALGVTFPILAAFGIAALALGVLFIQKFILAPALSQDTSAEDFS